MDSKHAVGGGGADDAEDRADTDRADGDRDALAGRHVRQEGTRGGYTGKS